jgi:hypothetical protein
VSLAAFCGDGEGDGREGGKEAGYLLIEQVRRAGNLRLTCTWNGGNHHLFSALPAQRHMGRRFLLRKSSVDPGLAGEKVLCCPQDFGRTMRGRRFLKSAIAL